MSKIVTRSRARNIFYGGSLFFIVVFVAMAQAAPLLSLLSLVSPVWLRVNGVLAAKRMLIAAADWTAVFALHLPVVGLSPVAGWRAR
jgi:hypothetical protein